MKCNLFIRESEYPHLFGYLSSAQEQGNAEALYRLSIIGEAFFTDVEIKSLRTPSVQIGSAETANEPIRVQVQWKRCFFSELTRNHFLSLPPQQRSIGLKVFLDEAVQRIGGQPQMKRQALPSPSAGNDQAGQTDGHNEGSDTIKKRGQSSPDNTTELESLENVEDGFHIDGEMIGFMTSVKNF